MPSFLEISPDKLKRIIGTPNAPVIIDVRTDDDFNADKRFVPTSLKRCAGDVAAWSSRVNRSAVVVCQHGRALSHGAAAYLRQAGVEAEVLEGGYDAWLQSNGPVVPEDKLPPRDQQDRTTWVTRARPKIDRVACPWLIRRFVDPDAIFLFVPASDVLGVADRFNGAPFDIEGVFWSHRAELCTFDLMIEEFGLASEPLLRLATIVRGADTARPDLAPEVAGLLAASLGLSRMFTDDLAQLDAGMMLYDAFYRWCRDATEETHNWPNQKKGQ